MNALLKLIKSVVEYLSKLHRAQSSEDGVGGLSIGPKNSKMIMALILTLMVALIFVFIAQFVVGSKNSTEWQLELSALRQNLDKTLGELNSFEMHIKQSKNQIVDTSRDGGAGDRNGDAGDEKITEARLDELDKAMQSINVHLSEIDKDLSNLKVKIGSSDRDGFKVLIKEIEALKIDIEGIKMRFESLAAQGESIIAPHGSEILAQKILAQSIRQPSCQAGGETVSASLVDVRDGRNQFSIAFDTKIKIDAQVNFERSEYKADKIIQRACLDKILDEFVSKAKCIYGRLMYTNISIIRSTFEGAADNYRKNPVTRYRYEYGVVSISGDDVDINGQPTRIHMENNHGVMNHELALLRALSIYHELRAKSSQFPMLYDVLNVSNIKYSARTYPDSNEALRYGGVKFTLSMMSDKQIANRSDIGGLKECYP
ncbi:hypothetical protein [Methylomagnum ishizawai]|uniref:hypothetical protein n=1 Tax=Methylomagnum ishizawai TaxID=1760988 RepID=UPI001C33C33C|nr:hypothetical protein [Methylomagnum ishizawai]BBL76470.1 hypothetical protein MishRS11D_35680 [Methylomagnum ishizawai]